MPDSIPSGAAKIRRGALISLLVGVALLIVKAAAYQLTGSSAVLSDALESIVNVVTAATALAVVRFSLAPADDEHPYGHGKAEFVSAAFEGGLIFFAAIAIVLESARALVTGVQLRSLDAGFLLMIAAALANLALGLYLRRVSRRGNSQALAASSAHVLSDVKTTVGVAIGLVAVRLTGWTWLDPLAAAAVGLHLGWEGWGILRGSFAGLLDETDPKSLELLSAAIRKVRPAGVIEIHHLRAIRSGSFHHVDAHLVVPEFWDILEAHEVADRFEKAVVAEYPFDGEIAFHLDPCFRRFCVNCDLEACPVREKPFEHLKTFAVSELTRAPEGKS